jgi:predicted secreted protein
MATHGYGTTLSGSISGQIAEIQRIGLPDQKVDDLDVTTMTSPDKYKEFIAGLIDAGTISMDVLYTKACYQQIQNALGVFQVWTITLPDGSTFVGSGYINAQGGESPYEDKITQNVGLKLSGKPAFTPAA